jgi:hypothetical protein
MESGTTEELGMVLTGGPRELERAIAPEFELRDDPEFNSDANEVGTAVIEEQSADLERLSEQGAWDLRASSGRRHDDDEDSDFGFDDFDHDDADEDEELDDDFDDDDDDDLDDDLDDFDASEEP